MELDEQWIGNAPESWEKVRLKDVSSFSPSYSAETPNANEVCTVIPMEAVSEQGQVDHSEQRPYETISNGLTLFEAGDVIFAKITPCMENGKGAFISGLPTRYAFGSTEFHVMRPFHKVDGQFLYYYTFNPTYRKYAEVNMVGAAGQKRVSTRFLKYTPLHLPEINEQRRIAAFLDQQCAAIDGAIAVKQQQLEKFDTLGKTVLSKAVLEGLDDNAPKRNPHSLWFSEIPARWDIRRLKDVSTMQTGITLGKDYDEPTEERPYLRVANVQDGHLALDDMKTINLPPTLIPRYELQPGDVLMTEGGDLDKLGRGYVWNNELPGCLHQNHVFALRCQPQKLLPDYLAMLTSSTHGRAYFEITGKKTTNLASTNATKVNQFPIPLPPIEEQARIVAWVKAELDKIQQARAVVSRQVEVLAEYKKSLIHECVTGKRRVVV